MEEQIKPVKKPAPKKRIGLVVASALNVRYAPTYDAAVATIIKQGKRVVITNSKDKDFYAVKFDDVEGYVAKEFIEIEGEN